MSQNIPDYLRRQVGARANFRCEYCRRLEVDSFFRYQCDHIIRRKHGGDTKFENLAYACPICNSAKGSDLATLSKDLKNLVRLFNPRIDTWSEHFKLESGTIISSTEIGTATIKLLKLNEVNRILERLDLIQAGLYP
ncbi:MAG: HNH endonuclease [Saprospiraceae bacterium]|nr:HNH endonuclease [Saprospiraceae bacterium]MBP8942031.1 HNH endonuclease [Saprospiraceae bacterium]MBP9746585.1 HNH endonuclease [Saprospiraceae bacterium]